MYICYTIHILFRVSIYEMGYSGSRQVSNSGTVQHITFGSVPDNKYPAANLNDESEKSDVIHPTSESQLRTTKASYIGIEKLIHLF